MTLRRDWEFTYMAGDVADAARRKREKHSDREAWWNKERVSVIAELKASGLEVTGYEVTGGMRHDVQFDPKLTKRLSECEDKIKSHSRAFAEFDMFARVLDDHADETLTLHPDDVDHFGLA